MKRKAKPFRCPCCGQEEGEWHKMSCYDPHRADDGHTVTAPYAMPPDSTEGWADALRAGVKAWWLDGSDIDFDFSQVREAGAILRVKGGRASGPEPLHELLATFKRVLLARQGQWRDCGPTVDQCLAGPNAPALKTGFCK